MSSIYLKGFKRCFKGIHHHKIFLNSKRYISTKQIVNNNATKSNIPWLKISGGLFVGGLLLYDGVVKNFQYSKSSARFLRSLKVVSLVSLDYMWLLSTKNKDENFASLLHEVHLKSANRILDTCLRNGGLYVKVGQGVAAVNHILPEEYISTLDKLQDKCLPSTTDDIRKVFIQDFGKPPEDIFQEFDYKPVAAASLAQVHKAKLQNGDTVAVKIQYLDLQQRFPSDLGTIIFLQDIVELIFKNYNFGWIFRNIRKNLEKEMDFINEGKNSEHCSTDLSKFNFIYIPKVYWDYTKTRVLTLEWISGYKINDRENLLREKISLSEVDIKLFKAFSEQIFNTGFIHGDPHPGNIFVRKGKSGGAELVLLDHGLYETLPQNLITELCKFWEATVIEDVERMKEAANKMNVQRYDTFAEILFQTPFNLDGAAIKSKLTEKDIEYMQNQARNNFNKIMQTLKEMPINLVFVVRNLNTIRAIGKDHGDPVNRPNVMARYAQKCLYKRSSFIGKIQWFFRKVRFEYHLLKRNIKYSLIAMYFNVLYALGRSPEKINLF